MAKVAIKSDKYELSDPYYNTDNYKDPKYSLPEGSEPYSEAPKYDVYKREQSEETGEDWGEFVFYEDKPVLFVGYHFSDVKVTSYERSWPIDDEGYLQPAKTDPKTGQHIPIDPSKAQKEENETGEEELEMYVETGSDYVFIDGIPMCQVTDEIGAYTKPDERPMYDEEGNEILGPQGSKKMDGEFTEYGSTVFID